jgi:short-subunit dehydrogenase
MTKSVLIMSSTSEIAASLARLYLSKNSTLLLHGRNEDKLNKLVAELKDQYPSGNIVKLPILDLILPENEQSMNQEVSSLLDKHYSSWFDSLVQKHGLPQIMIISGGGVGGYNCSSVLELNAVSAMKCCEQFIRKIKQHIHNEKYKHKKFHLLYMSSVAGESRDTMEYMSSILGHYVYSCSKNIMNNYLAKLRKNIGNLNLSICNAKIFLVDTQMLRLGLAKREKHTESLSLWSNIKFAIVRWLIDQTVVEPEYAAEEIKACIDSGEETFYIPRFAQYIVFIFSSIRPTITFFVNGIIFSALFVPSVRNTIIGCIVKLFKFISLS